MGDIVAYVLRKLAEGEDIAEIRKKLLDSGWKKEDVDEAIEIALKEKNERISLNSIKKMALIFTNPYDFFINVRFEQTLKKPAVFLAINTLIVALVLVLRWFFSNLALRTSFGMVVVFLSPLILFFSEILMFLIGIVFSFVVHLISKLFGNELPFPYTWKVTIYALAPFILSFLFFNTPALTYLSVPLLLWSLLLTMYGLYEVVNLSLFQGMVCAVLSYGFVFLVLSFISMWLFRNSFFLISKLLGF